MAWWSLPIPNLVGRLRLSPIDWLIAAEAWWALLWLDWLIRHRPYRQWRHWLDPRPVAPVPAAPRARRVIRITERVARHHLRPMNCLRRTLVEKRLLERRRVGCRLHIGVQASEQSIQAHAWLTDAAGTVLNDAPDVVARYRELTPEQWAYKLFEH